MLYGTVPFKANNMTDLQKLIRKAKYTLKDDISEEARELIKGLLERDPLERLTVEQILDHPWLKGSDKNCKFLNPDLVVPLFSQKEKDFI